MSAIIKSRLKAAREAIGRKDWDQAREAAAGVLEYEPDNYNANVFLGLALLNLRQTEDSEQAYRKAVSSSPDQPLAWQGLAQLYDQAHDWVKHADTLEHLTRLFAQVGDVTKCAETLQKLLDLRRDATKSNRMQLADTLSLMLPDSPLFPILSTLPPPDPTNPTSTTTHPTQAAVHNTLPILEEIVALYEQEEEETVGKEMAKRRTRLGAAGPEQIKKDVTREVSESSKLPYFYNEILNHPNTSDKLRRQTESKLLRHKQRHLYSLPSTGDWTAKKAAISAELHDLISGMVLLEIKDELAWMLLIEGKDAEHIGDYDLNILHRFAQLFPETMLSKIITAYFAYMDIVFPQNGDEDGQPEGDAIAEDDVDSIIDAFSSLTDSILAHRIMTEVYEHERDLENAIKVAESGIELVHYAEVNSGKRLILVRKAFTISLAVSLVHYYPPKHHGRALGLLNENLTQDANNVPCLMGRGYVLQYTGKFEEASQIYAKVVTLLPDDLEHGIRAKEEHAWCQANLGDLQNAIEEFGAVILVIDELSEKDIDKARCWWRLGKCYWDLGGDHREQAYRHFITSLKRSPTFASAFTSLGLYYSDFASPPDPNRASKCFQKAFELDSREVEAARRLAEGFAEEDEWDLVEVIARRTIDGEGGLDGGIATARYLPINAWAWKAVGAVELNRHSYAQAIQAFQIALRTDVDDQLSWLRLGEGYSKAGRFAAAIKALERSRELNPDDWVSSYFMGEVLRQTGEYVEAIKAFHSILVDHPTELGVLVSLGQAYLEYGRTHVATAYTARAEESFICSVSVALRLIEASPGFRRVAWKIAADATFHLSHFTIFSDEVAVREILAELTILVTDHPAQGLVGIISTPAASQASADISLSACEIAIVAYDYRISLDALDSIASGSAHYDLGMSLFAYSRRTTSSSKQERSRAEATRQFKEALQTQPGNDEYWIALGSVTFDAQPKISQHAYIKALEINSKNPIAWANLGLLYLYHGDADLANEAFYKAQTLDPDFALAWVGQGLVATANGHAAEARALFEHATGLSAPVPDADVEFAKRLFNKLNTTVQSGPSALSALLPAFFVLDRFCRERPQNAFALHLFGLVCERIGHLELGIEMIDRTIAILEAAYEDNEDATIENQFTIAHTNMARLRLALQDYEGALESYQVANGLLSEVPEDSSSRVLFTQVQFGSGLAHFKLGRLADALGLFEAAMTTAADDVVVRSHVVVLLAQTLWALRTEDGKESAKTQLLQSIETDPDNLLAINTLAGMGILTDDSSLVDAALSEILALPLDQRLERDPTRDVTYLLIQHYLGQNDTRQALSVAQKAVIMEPSRPEIRHDLARLTLQDGHGGALAILAGSSAAPQHDLSQLRESLHLQAISWCLRKKTDPKAAKKAHCLAQKAIMLCPSELRNWRALAFVRTTL